MLSAPATLDPSVRDRPLKTLASDPQTALTGSGPAVSWGAITAGAAAIAALSVSLLALGTGLGLSSLSPWAGRGASATAVGIAAVAWMAVTQLMACGLGGYLAGRLRSRWVAVQRDEVFFRDTAHGFLAWAVATLVTAVWVAAALGSLVQSGTQAGAALTTLTPITAAGPSSYLVDALFRKEASASAIDTTASVQEASRIFLNSLPNHPLPADDLRYTSQLVSQHTGLSPAEAEKRVTDTYSRAQAQLQLTDTELRATAEQARKATIGASLWLFVSLLIGAFSASFAATYGGRERDL